MAKKKTYSGGSEDRKRRGLRSILVPVTPEAHALISLAAGTHTGPERAITRWAAAVLEAAARKRLDEVRGQAEGGAASGEEKEEKSRG